MINFDKLVHERAPETVYTSYHDIALRHQRNELSVKQFRNQLEQLFKNYHDILELLPSFFSDSGDVALSEQPQAKPATQADNKAKCKK